MSFMNNEWSWFLIPATAFYAVIASLVILRPLNLVARFRRSLQPASP
jgi:hypothetical protein